MVDEGNQMNARLESVFSALDSVQTECASEKGSPIPKQTEQPKPEHLAQYEHLLSKLDERSEPVCA